MKYHVVEFQHQGFCIPLSVSTSLTLMEWQRLLARPLSAKQWIRGTGAPLRLLQMELKYLIDKLQQRLALLITALKAS